MNEIVLDRRDLFVAGHTSGGKRRDAMVAIRVAFEQARKRWNAYRRFLRELEVARSLDDRLLADMGLTRAYIRASRRAGRWICAAERF